MRILFKIVLIAAVISVTSFGIVRANSKGAENTNVNPVLVLQDPTLVALFDCRTGKEVWHKTKERTKPPLLLAAAGFCELHGGNGNFSCAQGTCSGSCKLNNYPASCSCN